MPEFIIEAYELHTQKFKVEAATRTEAIEKFERGEADCMDNTMEYIEPAELYGATVQEIFEGASSEEITKFCESEDLNLTDPVWGIRGIEEE